MRAARRSAAFSRCAALLIAAALIVRALVPAGFMPLAQGGALRVTLCSEGGAQRAIEVPLAPAGRHADQGCAFCALDPPGEAPPSFPAELPRLTVATAPTAPGPPPALIAAHPPAWPPARGPPPAA